MWLCRQVIVLDFSMRCLWGYSGELHFELLIVFMLRFNLTRSLQLCVRLVVGIV